jgi:glycerophosphoryl diester phosphodiesterase
MTPPLILAHRGASAHAPENTLASFARAIQDKADGIELDVWKCGSGEVVVTHNRNVKILTGKGGNLQKMSLSQLRKLDFGKHHGNVFHGEKIPTLKEVLDLTGGMELINIEIKGMGIRSDGIELDVAELIQRFKLLRRVVVSSFNPTILLRLQKINPALHLGLLLSEKSPLALRRGWSANLLKPYSLHPSFPLLKPALIQKTHQKGAKVFSWTINTPHQLQTCIKYQIDAIITDDPAWARKAMENVKREG